MIGVRTGMEARGKGSRERERKDGLGKIAGAMNRRQVILLLY